MGGARVLIMSQILAVCSVAASDALPQCTHEGECFSEHVSMIQKLIDVSRHNTKSISEMTNALLSLKKEHFWALSQQGVVGKSGAHFDKISEKTMAALFGEKLKHLTTPEQAQLQRGISDAVRSNRTRMNDMMRALCWLDDLTKASGAPQHGEGALPIPMESQSKGNSVSISFDLNGLFNSLMNGKGGGEKNDPLSQPADMPSPEAEPEPEGKCGDFSGKWVQQESQTHDLFATKCEAYSTEGSQDGCALTAISNDAWWGHSVSLNAHGNKVQIKPSACSSKVFEGTLSDDGNTLSWNDGCTWTKVQPSLWTRVSNHWAYIAGFVVLAGGVGAMAYFKSSA